MKNKSALIMVNIEYLISLLSMPVDLPGFGINVNGAVEKIESTDRCTEKLRLDVLPHQLTRAINIIIF